jgi:DNA-binding transcriptional MocR family regulator
MCLEQLIEVGAGQATIAAVIERAIADGLVAPGARLPPVRDLAERLEVSPATVAGAYRTLRQRGLVTTSGRRGTAVSVQPPLAVRRARPLPPNVRDLAGGNPDPALLPPLGPALARVSREHTLYGAAAKLDELVTYALDDFAADGIDGAIAVVGGALDGIERILQTRLRPGDAIALEDPTWPRITDLVQALGFVPEPVALDEYGLLPDSLARALRRRVRAVIATPRGQNPTGAALDLERSTVLREVIGGYPDVLVVEDDYVAAVAGTDYFPLHGSTTHWVVVRSLSKVVGPDLRIALMAGDQLTVSRVEGRQLLGPGWVSHLLQQTAAQLLGNPSTRTLLARAGRTYARRREALIDALAGHGIHALGRSGLGVWVPVREEAATVQHLLERGWAVSAGERYRFQAPPGIRITTTALEPAEAKKLAAALAQIALSGTSTYAG